MLWSCYRRVLHPRGNPKQPVSFETILRCFRERKPKQFIIDFCRVCKKIADLQATTNPKAIPWNKTGFTMVSARNQEGVFVFKLCRSTLKGIRPIRVDRPYDISQKNQLYHAYVCDQCYKNSYMANISCTSQNAFYIISSAVLSLVLPTKHHTSIYNFSDNARHEEILDFFEEIAINTLEKQRGGRFVKWGLHTERLGRQTEPRLHWRIATHKAPPLHLCRHIDLNALPQAIQRTAGSGRHDKVFKRVIGTLYEQSVRKSTRCAPRWQTPALGQYPNLKMHSHLPTD